MITLEILSGPVNVGGEVGRRVEEVQRSGASQTGLLKGRKQRELQGEGGGVKVSFTVKMTPGNVSGRQERSVSATSLVLFKSF